MRGHFHRDRARTVSAQLRKPLRQADRIGGGMRIARQRTDTAHADRAEIAARNLQRLKRLRDQISGRCLAISTGDADAEQVLRSIVVVAGCNLARTRGELWHGDLRSEEHTSELQSLMRTSYAVFCL